MSRYAIAVVVSVIGGCQVGAPAPSAESTGDPSTSARSGATADPSAAPTIAAAPAIDARHRPPVLSSKPLWAVSEPNSAENGCFGNSIAVGDLDGDGHRDVIVAQQQCLFGTVIPGRIAIYRGGRDRPSTSPVWTNLDWQNPGRGGRQLTAMVGDVDGDHRDDLVLRSQAGVQVFAGIRDLGAPLGAPTFRIPFTGAFGPAILVDVNGDHRDDIVESHGGATHVWLSTPGAAGGPFTESRVIALPAALLIAAGDANGDGVDDIVFVDFSGSGLFHGCSAGEPGCDGGLQGQPAWTISDKAVLGMVPDLNHDGLAEAFAVGIGGFGLDSGRAALLLSDRKTGGLETTPVWTMIGDANYVGLGNSIVFPGDLDGDRRTTDFVLTSAGRVYAFFARSHGLARLEAGFAWPQKDTVQAQSDTDDLFLDGETTTQASAAGDVNRDGFDDLAIGDPSVFPDGHPGHVFLVAGGEPPARRDPPLLGGAPVCDLDPAGKPDLTVDADALGRSLFVDRVTFAPDACAIVEGCVGAPGERRLLRFSTTFENRGGSPAIIPGPDTAPELYHLNTCENELELSGFADYALVDESGTTIAAGHKENVFPLDVQPLCVDAGTSNDYFPDTGISPGWADVYVSELQCQWLDATDVPDGRYTLRITIDVNHLVDQDDVHPDTVSIPLELRGDRVTILHNRH